MKKFVAGIAVLCLIFTGLFSYFQIKNREQEKNSASDQAAQLAALQEALETLPTVDYQKLFASHEPDDLVGKINGRDIPWREYFRAYFSYSTEIEEYMKTMMMYYGSAPSWTDVYNEEKSLTFQDLPSTYAEDDLKQNAAIEQFSRENGITLNDENKKKIEQIIQENIVSYCGEGATEKDFEDFLAKSYTTENDYRNMLETNFLYQQMFTDLYGENGVKVGNTEAVNYLKEKGYTAAEHILFMTMDRETGESIGEEAAKEKLKKAEEVAAELTAIEDETERYKRFKEIQKEYNEDTGAVNYPNGYTYTSGTMVEAFEKAASELKEYEISEPVETAYGYHVIMRIPLDGEAVINYSEAGAPLTAKSKIANEEYGKALQNAMDSMKIEYSEGFEKPIITEYLNN